MRHKARRWRARSIVGVALAATLASTPPANAAPAMYPVYDIGTALAKSAANPAASPPGVNVPCTPSAEHPQPVVLVSGTHANMMLNWGGLGPTLANEGYCVYSAAIGGDPHDFIQTCGPVEGSIAQIAQLVDTVLAETGARTVDLVGHSQGGLIAEYYTKFYGRNKVSNVALLSPTTHGSTVNGATSLPEPLRTVAMNLLAFDCPAVYDQLPTADIIRKLNTGPVTVPGVDYTVIETRYEFVVTPSPSAAFIDEEGVENVIVQDYCPQDLSDHMLLAYSRTAWSLVLNALDHSPPTQVGC